MKIFRNCIRSFIIGFFVIVLFGCVAIRQIENGGVPEGKTFTQTELSLVLTSLSDYSQNVVRNELGISEWGGIWVPNYINKVKGGQYTFYVILNGHGNDFDFRVRKERILQMYPGSRIITSDYLQRSIIYPQTVLGRTQLRLALTGRAVNGYSHIVDIPPLRTRVITPTKPQKSHSVVSPKNRIQKK
jgi:hypothetical protein